MGFPSQVEYWKIRSNGLRDIARGEVCVMLFGNASVRVAKLSRNDAHRYAPHREMRSVGMPQDMEVDGR